MNSSIETLLQIQKIDLEINAMEAEEKGLRSEAAALTAELKKLEDEILALNDEAERLNAALKEAEEKVRQSVDKAKKDEKRLGEVKNDRELSAITKQIAETNKMKKLGEQEVANLNAKITDKKSLLDARQVIKNEKEAGIKNAESLLEAKQREWEEGIALRKGRKDGLKAGIGPDMLKRYESIREKRGGRAVVSVKDEACQGCFIHMPPQIYIQLKKGTEEIISCQHCHRMLFVEEEGRPASV
ncbi:MAG: C4-type zinc ribbon domain-containing protein [Deltaproteobacteria bacterium]